MEGMLNDLSNADSLSSEFKTYLSTKGIATPRGIDFTVQVLTTGWWPTFVPATLALPAELAGCQDIFATYYASVKQHRKLAWVHSQGTASVRGAWGRNVYDLGVVTLQAVVLLHFNDKDGPQGFEAVRTALNMEPEILKRTLHSLSCGRLRVLTKSPEGNTINSSDTFAWNAGFTCQLRKVRIPMASLEETHNTKRVEEDRAMTIEACVVRIMKARKTMPHQGLVSEVMSQVRRGARRCCGYSAQ